MTIQSFKQKVITCLLILIVVISNLPMTVSAETTGTSTNPTAIPHTFSISNTIIGYPEDKDNHEFSFTGKIQEGFSRSATPGDYWYGTSDKVYEGLKIYRSSFEYKKIDSAEGSIIERGTITPNGYGLFSFTLKHNETIEFFVNNLGDMNFYLFQTPDEEYTTKSVLDGVIFAKTVNVKTGAVIGVGGIPGGMETRYYEENQENFGQEFAPRLQPLNGNIKADFYNTSLVAKKTYKVSYSFSCQDGKEKLPPEVLELLPEDQTNVEEGTTVVFEIPDKTEVAVEGGKWVFQGYSFVETTITDRDVEAVGTWIFIENVIPKTFKAGYIFVAKPPEIELPHEVSILTPQEEGNIEEGTTVAAVLPEKSEVVVDGGRWVFEGYTFDNATVRGEDILFVGEWIYAANIVPREKPSEGDPEKPSQGETEKPSQGETEKPSGNPIGDESGSGPSPGGNTETPKTPERTTQIGKEKHPEGSHIRSMDPIEGGDSTEDVKKDAINKEVAATEIGSTEKPWHRLIRCRYAPFALVIMAILEALLYASIMSDVRVLRWYHQKKKINMVIK